MKSLELSGTLTSLEIPIIVQSIDGTFPPKYEGER